MHTDLFNKQNRTSFVLNFLAVVLGIVITFGWESLISHREEEESLRNCLDLVASELGEDMGIVRFCDSLASRETAAAAYLIKYERHYGDAPSDSLYAVANTPFLIEDVKTCTDAFELLKSSGVLTGIKDKKLALDIFKAYGAMEELASYINAFYAHKMKYLEPVMNDDVKRILAGDRVTAVNLWSAITATKEGRQFLREVPRFLSSYDSSEIRGMLDSVIAEIEAYGR